MRRPQIVTCAVATALLLFDPVLPSYLRPIALLAYALGPALALVRILRSYVSSLEGRSVYLLIGPAGLMLAIFVPLVLYAVGIRLDLVSVPLAMGVASALLWAIVFVVARRNRGGADRDGSLTPPTGAVDLQ